MIRSISFFVIVLNFYANATTHTSNPLKGKVTIAPLDKIARKQQEASEACLPHVSGSDEADDCHGSANAVTGQGNEQLHANRIEVKEKIPVELKILVDSVHLMSDKNLKLKVMKGLKNLEKVLGHLESETEILLIKNEIYKALIEYPHPSIDSSTVESHSDTSFDSFFQKNKSQLLPLAQWICEAILKELKQIPNIPLDNPFSHSKMETQRRILETWLGNLKGKSITEINLSFEHVILALINGLHQRLALFLKYSKDFRRPQKIPILRIHHLASPQEKITASPEVKNIEKGIAPPESSDKKLNWKPLEGAN